jgi:Uma2 family endonuclease
VSKLKTGQMTAEDYERAAWEYYRSLPLEHFMEATPQATQRKIALESLDLLQARCPGMQTFNELLIQYVHEGELCRVVPDNFVVLTDDPFRDRSSFNMELEPARPFWVLEWVSTSSEGKDYEDSFRKYEHELQVLYCLMFHPEDQDLRFYRHTGDRYLKLKPHAQGRYVIEELELQIGLLDGWVRFWHHGELLELPAELERRLQEERRRADRERQHADEEEQRAEQEKQRADQERLGRLAAEAEVAKLRALLGQSAAGPASGNGA